jgi:hypothetical protein
MDPRNHTNRQRSLRPSGQSEPDGMVAAYRDDRAQDRHHKDYAREFVAG